MNHNNQVMNTNLAPPGESSKPKETRFIMNMVDSRYQNYSRPLIVMTLVAVLKFVLMITMFLIIVMSAKPKKETTSCTKVTSYQQ